MSAGGMTDGPDDRDRGARPDRDGVTGSDARSGAEPGEGGRRLDGVTRPTPPADHLAHDESLIAALVSGDLDGDDADRAADLVRGCAACALLASDLSAITIAIRAMPDPARSRDFRLSAEQAAAVRRTGLRRFLPSSGSLGFARPLGTALATLGLAGLLVTSILGGQFAAFSSGARQALLPVAGPSDMSARAPEAGASSGTSDSASKGGAAAPSPAASATNAVNGSGGSIVVPDQGPAATALPAFGASSAPSPAAAPSAAGSIVPASPMTQPPASSAAQSPTSSPGSTAQPLVPAPSPAGGTSGGIPIGPAASVLALVAGLGLLGADRVARRR
jgi:hypothetical protein